MQTTTVTHNAAGGKPDKAKACFQSDRLHFVFEREQITLFVLDWHNVSYKSCSALTAHVGHAPLKHYLVSLQLLRGRINDSEDSGESHILNTSSSIFL